MLTLSTEIIHHLKQQKNLLAFSGGVDSSALFFLLQNYGISFDIAIIDYGLRKQSQEEVEYAMNLGKEYNIKVHTTQSPHFEKNFEKSARDFRYSFFDLLIEKNKYQNLITAHQLNDQLEWLLMRLTKGAGVSELIGLDEISKRKSYTLIRPILHHSKEELIAYLKENQHIYFVDESNFEEKYERNYFRKRFANELISKYRKGVQKSFSYLKEDKAYVLDGYREIFNHKELYILEIKNQNIKVRLIDRYLKKLGYLLSSGQRSELKESNSIVIGGLWAIEVVDNILYIAPHIKEVMPKRYKEACRVARLPSKIRCYCHKEELEPKKVSLSL